MLSVKNILVGVDLKQGDHLVSKVPSAETKACLKEGIELAQATGGQLTLCTVIDIGAQGEHLVGVDEAEFRRSLEDVATEALEALAKEFRSQELPIAVKVRFGTPWKDLVSEVIEQKHDLVIVSTQPKTISQVLFGDLAQNLMRFCPCPVWVVKPSELREVREVAVATDLGDMSVESLFAGVAIAKSLNAKLFVIHAVDLTFEVYLKSAGYGAEVINRSRENALTSAREKLLEQLSLTDHRTLHHGCVIQLLEGTPEFVIPQFVTKNEVDLVVMGTRGRSGLSGFLMGNTVEKLLPSIHASVLVVKPADFVSPIGPESH